MKAKKSKKATAALLTIVFTLVLLISSIASCEQTIWDCPECGKTGNSGNYCGSCKHPAPWIEETKSPGTESRENAAAADTTTKAELTARVKELTDKLAAVEKAKDEAEAQVAELTKTASEAAVAAVSAISAKAELEGQVRELTEKLAVSESAAKTAAEEASKAKDAAVAAARTELETQVKELKEKLAAAEAMITELNKAAEARAGAATTEKSDIESFKTVGNIVTFGQYEQDNNTNNGKEPIEWIVLDYDKKNSKALLLSKYGLDAKKYNDQSESSSWEKCTLCTWLNGAFLQSAFLKEQQDAILMTAVDNSASQGYSGWGTYGGSNVKNRIFLLSYAEANRYLNVTIGNKRNVEARIAPTTYAIANEASTISNYQTPEGADAGWWWLRSPGYYQHNAALVNSGGYLASRDVTSDDVCVRPALWINLMSGIF